MEHSNAINDNSTTRREKTSSAICTIKTIIASQFNVSIFILGAVADADTIIIIICVVGQCWTVVALVSAYFSPLTQQMQLPFRFNAMSNRINRKSLHPTHLWRKLNATEIDKFIDLIWFLFDVRKNVERKGLQVMKHLHSNWKDGTNERPPKTRKTK